MAISRCHHSGPFAISQAQHGDFKSGALFNPSPSEAAGALHTPVATPAHLWLLSFFLSVFDAPRCVCRLVIFVCVSVPVGLREPKIHVQCPLWSQALSLNLELIEQAAQLERPGVFLSAP